MFSHGDGVFLIIGNSSWALELAAMYCTAGSALA